MSATAKLVTLQVPSNPPGPGALHEVEVLPGLQEDPETLRKRAERRGVTLAMEVVSRVATIRGWFLPPEGTELHGLRAVSGHKTFVARRKQLRPDVFARYPVRPEAVFSGFTLEVPIGLGWNRLELQYKGSDRRWHEFSRCDLLLSPLWKLKQAIWEGAPSGGHEIWSRTHSDPDEAELASMRSFLPKFPRQPLVSVLMPVYNAPPRWLRRAIESVRQQVYPHWELCIADDHSTDAAVRRLLLEYAAADGRISVRFLPENGHICESSNAALELCSGEFTVLLDHDDELPPHALFHVAWEAANHPECDVIFSDEDKVDEHGMRREPFFKPGWNYDLLLGQNFVSHLGAFRTSKLKEIGGFRPGYEGSQDWDLALRAIGSNRGESGAVRHIPRILYHWRAISNSTALNASAKPYAHEAGGRAVADHLRTNEPGAEVRAAGDGKWQVIWPLPDPEPSVSLIISSRERVDLLRGALETHFALTDYSRVEILIVDHQAETKEVADYATELAAAGRNVRLIPVTGEFNWSAFNNLGAACATGDVLVFLNNDIEVISSDWLRELIRQAWRPGTGAVGACLLYQNGQSIQHGGVTLNLAGLAGHAFRHGPTTAASVGGTPDLVREVTAVTGACMAVRAETFRASGGFAEQHLPVAYNDVDFCLRLRSLGLRNLYTPFARLIHLESASRGASEALPERKAAAAAEAQVLLQRWPEEFRSDPFWNPNLSLSSEFPIAGPPRITWPWELENAYLPS